MFADHTQKISRSNVTLSGVEVCRNGTLKEIASQSLAPDSYRGDAP